VGGSEASAWWKDLVHIPDGVGLYVGNWFEYYLWWKSGNGANTLFWADPWLGDFKFCDRFKRLFHLIENCWIIVVDMFHLGWG